MSNTHPLTDALCDKMLADKDSDRVMIVRLTFLASELEEKLGESKKQAAQADELYNHMHDYADERDAAKKERDQWKEFCMAFYEYAQHGPCCPAQGEYALSMKCDCGLAKHGKELIALRGKSK